MYKYLVGLVCPIVTKMKTQKLNRDKATNEKGNNEDAPNKKRTILERSGLDVPGLIKCRFHPGHETHTTPYATENRERSYMRSW